MADKSFIVRMLPNGEFLATNTDDPNEVFQTEYWHSFHAELYHRLLNETPSELRKAPTRESGNTKST